MADDNVQHGVDDSPTGDAEKGATLGGVGGAVTGAIAGAAAGPIGAVAGAIIGGVAGAVASGAAVAAIDRVDNDNTVSGVGDGVHRDGELTRDDDDMAARGGVLNRPMMDNGMPGVQTGGYAVDGTPDTRGILEKTSDAVTGDRYDDKTGRPVGSTGVYDSSTTGTTGMGTMAGTTAAGTGYTGVGTTPVVDNGVPGVQTGGRNADGTPDTRGILEKTTDAVTGDHIDDKTGRRTS